MNMTKQQALKEFNDTIAPQIPKGDKPMFREAWNNFTDHLCKSGFITGKQYSNWSNPF